MNKLTLMSVFTVILLSLFSCKTIDEANVYQNNQEHHYKVVMTDREGDELLNTTIVMEVSKLRIQYHFTNKVRLRWYVKDDRRTRDRTFLMEDSVTVALIPPHRLEMLDLLPIAPVPATVKPPSVNQFLETEIDLTRRDGDFKGEVAVTENRVEVQENCRLSTDSDLRCWRIIGTNASFSEKHGQYTVISWFNEEHGFVKWEYTFPDRNKHLTFERIML
jgi:hypothetical protein